jgi:hypothetical protein
MSNEKVIKFRNALYRIFSSEEGKTVLDFLEESYVDSPAICDKTEHTFYKLGQKEFVQGLIKDAKQNPADIEKLLNGEINE